MRSATRSAEQEAMDRNHDLDSCTWPQCDRKPWLDLDLPLCPTHSAKVHLVVEDAIPKPVIRDSSPAGKPKVGHVYFARVGKYIKIGYSTNIEQRMKSIGGTHLASYQGARSDEAAAHREFAEYRVSSEFFRAGPRLVQRIHEVARTAA